jgi:hypothetical protein
MLFMARSEIGAVTTGPLALRLKLALAMSAGPNSKPMSDGLIGVASTRTSTSFSAGAGTGTGASDSSSSPLALTSERSCRAVLSVGVVNCRLLV